MYANGVGTEQDYFEAAIWFRQAAERNVPEAQYNLGLAYELGRGLTKDEALAVKWYRAASDQGYARARYNLGLMIEEGRGIAADETAAATLYRAAAEQGFGPAQNNYGIMLAEGRGGLVPNLVEAYVWLALAAENGVNPVGRDLVARQLQPGQIAQARARMAALKAPPGERPAVADAGTAPAEPTGQASAALAAKLSGMEAELAKARDENTRLASFLQNLQQEKSRLEERISQLSATARSAPAEQERILLEKNSSRPPTPP
ncbi:MAG: SEL1-like repeat protein [Opitutaceae bacterium]|nr:SEL1-like repeat protein [Opitutaceae bacterium]